MPPLKNLVGNNYGMLLVIKRATNKGRSTRWLCICECGQKTIVHADHLKSGHTKSCGCYRNTFKSLPDGEASFNALYANYKRRHQFSIDKDTFKKLTKKDCYYCGRPPFQEYKNNNRIKSTVYIYNGLDRVNNSLGYTSNNVVPCCGNCNQAKRNLSQDEFISLCNLIASRHPNNSI